MQGKPLLPAGIAVAAFLVVTAVLGAAVLFVTVIFLIGVHGGGVLPEWSHLPTLAILAVGVGLKKIFPQGVCDYSKLDQASPRQQR